MLRSPKELSGRNEMYGMSGPELLTQLKVNDALRDAKRLHRVSELLKERKAARHVLFSLNRVRFWRVFTASKPALQSPSS
jgi:hypothetical protein